MTFATEYDEMSAGEREIQREHFIRIWGFMLTDFKLDKTELIVYAVIFGIYRQYCDCFVGSRKYLQSWCNASKSAVDNALVSLEEKNLIVKKYRAYGRMKRAVYYINTEALPRCEMFRLENQNADNNKKIREAEKRASLGL